MCVYIYIYICMHIYIYNVYITRATQFEPKTPQRERTAAKQTQNRAVMPVTDQRRHDDHRWPL